MANSSSVDNEDDCTKSKRVNGRYVNPWKTWRDPSIAKFIFNVYIKEKLRGGSPSLPSKFSCNRLMEETRVDALNLYREGQKQEQPRRTSDVKIDKGNICRYICTFQSVLDETLPIIEPDFTIWQQKHEPDDNTMKVMWIGHATVLVQFDGITVITDPQFSMKSSPIQWLMGATRYRPTPCTEQDLPTLDVVLISHSHYDHLDVDSCRNLHAKFGTSKCHLAALPKVHSFYFSFDLPCPELQWFVPLGLRDWMLSTLSLASSSDNVHEMDWWQESGPELNINGRVLKVAFTPAQHWCKRTALDDNKVLWGSWCVFSSEHSFYFAGDTGYCEAFKQIAKKYGKFDLAAIPIGAYSPRWFMEPQHVDPDQAVRIHKDIGAKYSLGIHWGTFMMTYEPYLEPRELLSEARDKHGVSDESFITLQHGETKIFH